ncbi:hypothetical protein ABEX29_25965 [Brevibacillus porteri]|uniref:hypothetical protein n=1 Tax=Brevibacillus porteri TaxID=2126350 RepID=UPI003D1AB646
MRAGRELDRKVADALGLTGYMPCNADDCKACDQRFARFSTSWEGMGVLVGEARKQGIYLDILTNEKVYIAEAKKILNKTIGSSTKKEAPHAGCLAYLNAHGIAV